jgi:transcription elongation factor Elf1
MATFLRVPCPRHGCKGHTVLTGEKDGRYIFRCPECGRQKSFSKQFIDRSFNIVVINDNPNSRESPPLPQQCLGCHAPALSLKVNPDQVSASCGQCGTVIVYNSATGSWEKVD